MIITNTNNLPDAFVRIAERQEAFEENEIRVTSLLSGLRETELKRRYADKITMDASECIWMTFGTLAHKVLEETDEAQDEFREERLKMKISKSVLTGKSDVFKDGIVIDYKTSSVWKIVYGDYEDWRKQLLLYAMLWKNAGFEVKGGQIVAMLKDQSKSKARTDANYPQLPVVTLDFTFTDKDIEDIRKYATERVKALEMLRDIPDDKLPLCTAEERYNSGDKYAIMKKGRKTALKVCDTKEEAEKLLSAKGGDYIEERKGEDRKCQDYCMVREFCPHARRQT